MHEKNASSIETESTSQFLAEQESLFTEADKEILARLSYVPGLKKVLSRGPWQVSDLLLVLLRVVLFPSKAIQSAWPDIISLSTWAPP